MRVKVMVGLEGHLKEKGHCRDFGYPLRRRLVV